MGIAEVDTRALTRQLRDTGAMVGVICTDPAVSDADLLAQARGWTLDGKDMISVVSTEKQYAWKNKTDSEWCAPGVYVALPETAPSDASLLVPQGVRTDI